MRRTYALAGSLLALLLCALLLTYSKSDALPTKDGQESIVQSTLNSDFETLYAQVSELVDRDVFSNLLPVYQKRLVEVVDLSKTDPRTAFDLPMTCFAPGTSVAELENFYKFYDAVQDVSLKVDFQGFQAPDGNRWGITATNGGGLGQGDPTTLTWSYVPDGTVVMTGCGVPGEVNGDMSNLIAFLDGIYGGPTTPGDFTTAPWHTVFVNIFADWASKSGLTFIYEPNDDGVSGPTPFATFANPGVLGVRGDVRIGGHRIDGNSMVLACNYFPNTGDMIIDTDDNFYGTPGNPPADPTGFTNVLTHEIGHGLGFRHVCPINQTKLMEPFVTFAFAGAQEDDILACNRLYGDTDESNETSGAATGLGAVAVPGNVTRNGRSIDDNVDVDFYSFSFAGSADAMLTMTPTGSTYLNGPQNPNGSCSAGTNFNSLIVADLQVELIAPDGTTVLATGNTTGAGMAETAMATGLAAGTYFARVTQQASAAAQDVQLYDLQIALAGGGTPVCMVSAISTTNFSACNDNGTPTIPGDDFFTADVTVTFANAPAGGSLDLSGDGTATTAILNTPTMHTFTNVQMSADGGPISLTATFSAMPTCNFTNTNAGTAPGSCSMPPLACMVSAISATNFSACNDNGTPTIPGDDFFTADVTVTFANAPAGGSLDLSGDGTATTTILNTPTMHTFTNVQMSADGGPISLTATFSGMPTCTFTNTNAGTAPGSCSMPPLVCMITAISTTDISDCDDNGTLDDPLDDFFTANVTVTYANPPSTGTLGLSGDATASIGVGALGSPTTYTFNGIQMAADGTPISLTASFSSDGACTLTDTDTGTAPMSCSMPLVPTMGEWGLIILGLFLAIFGSITILNRRRKTAYSMVQNK